MASVSKGMGKSGVRDCRGREEAQWKESLMGYVSEFLSLKCSPDVLGIVNPLGPRAEKEITEAMGMAKAVRGILLAKKMHYTVYDLCAGNGLVGVLIAHLLPAKRVVCVDRKLRKRHWHLAKRFEYVEADIMGDPFNWYKPRPNEPTIIVACHPCKHLAVRVAQLYHLLPFTEHLVMMPCCRGGLPKGVSIERLIQDKLTRYDHWVLGLARTMGGDCWRDSKILSPCNGIVCASRWQ